MTSATQTLFREGPDLDAVLGTLEDDFGGQARVVEVTEGRDGGVMGFFARRTVGVHFTVDDDATDPAPADPLDTLVAAAEAADAVRFAAGPERFATRAAAAATVESGVATVDDAGAGNVEFARMLLDIASAKAAERQASTPAVTTPPVPAPSALFAPAAPSDALLEPLSPATLLHDQQIDPVDYRQERSVDHVQYEPAPRPRTYEELLATARTRPVGAHRASEAAAPAAPDAPDAAPTSAAPAPDAAPIAAATPAQVPSATPAPAPAPVQALAPQRVQQSAPAPINTVAPPASLRDQLVALGVTAQHVPADATSAFGAVEQLVRALPAAPAIELGPGRIVVVAGPGALAHAEARRLCAAHRLDPQATIRTAGGPRADLSHRRQAAALEMETRDTRGEPRIVAVATDATADLGGADDLLWAAGIVDALQPDHLVLVVDAATRAADVRATATTLGAVSALAVVHAARTAAPAELWQTGLPVATLDGRPATAGTWAALLIDRLGR